MRTEIQEIKVYKYEELSDEAKEKVRYENYLDYPSQFVTESMVEYIKEKYPYFSKDLDIIYSLSNCQGDGVSFSCAFNMELFLNEFFKSIPNWKRQTIIDRVYINVESNKSNHYCFASRGDVYIDCFDYPYNFDRFEKYVIDNIESYIKTKYMTCCKELEKLGYDDLEYSQSEEYAFDTAESNEYEYTEDGKIY